MMQGIIHELRWLRHTHRRIDVALDYPPSLRGWNRSVIAQIRKLRDTKPLQGRAMNELVWLLLILQRLKIALTDPSYLILWRSWVLHHITLLEADYAESIAKLKDKLKDRKRKGCF